MASLASRRELDDIDRNKSSDSEFFDDLRNHLSRRGVGLHNRTTSCGLDKGQTASVDLECIVIGIFNLLGREIGMAMSTVLAGKLLIPGFRFGPGA